MALFVVHKHKAKHLHWDLRLELENVLKSWAVPKQPPLKKGLKRLAIEVEDHPLSYADFEGVIPEGNYGAGKVEIWDRGNYEIINWKENKIVFSPEGKRMRGVYVLLRFAKQKKNWLLFKK